MKDRTARVLRIFRVIHSISIVVCGICLMCACVSIYRSGDAPYSRESVAAAFSVIAVPVYLCIGLTLVNAIVAFLFPQEPGKPRRSQDLQATLTRLCATRDLSADPDVTARIQAERTGRRRRSILRWSTLVILSLCFLIYALNADHFHDSDINGSMVKAMYRLVPGLLLAFSVTDATLRYQEKSMITEIELLKSLPKNNAPMAQKAAEPEKKIALLRLGFIVAAIGLVTLGAATGGIADVLAKAVNICTECIGLG